MKSAVPGASKLDTAAMDSLHKEFAPEMAPVPAPSPELMAKINLIAGEEIPPEVLYVRQGKVCNDQYDRSDERFPVEYLQRFAQTLPGKTLLAAHNKERLPIGKWVEAAVVKDGDGVHHLVGSFYMSKRNEAAELVRLGIAKDLSIGFKAAGRLCDLCGEPYDGPKPCGHVKGRTYDGKLCTATYGGDLARVEALEASLVHVGCQYGAHVVGQKDYGTLQFDAGAAGEESEMELKEAIEKMAGLSAENDDLKLKLKAAESSQERAAWAEKFLRAEIQRLENTVADDQKAGEETLKILGANPTLEQLEACYERAKKAFNAKFSGGMQSHPAGDGQSGEKGAADAPKPGADKPWVFDPMRSQRQAWREG